jgi:hypothetical protein
VSRIRTIKPELLDDDKAAELPHQAWRLMVSVFVLADDHGRIRASIRYLAANVFSGDREGVEEARERLCRDRFWILYRVNGEEYALIRTFRLHQRIDNAASPRLPDPLDADEPVDLSDVPTDDEIEAFRGGQRRQAVTPRNAAKTPAKAKSAASRRESPRNAAGSGSLPRSLTKDPEREERARTDAIPAVEPYAVGCTSPEAPHAPSGASPVAEVEVEAVDAPQPRGEASGAKVAPPPPVLVALVEPEPEDDPPRRVEPPADWGAFDEDLLDPDDAGAREGIAIYNAHRHLSLPEWSTARGCSPPAGLVATMRDDAAREREAGSGASLEPWGLHRRSGWLAFAEATHGAPKLHEWKWELGMFFTGANKGPRTCRGFEFRQTLARGGYVRSFDKPARETAAERQIRENVEATREAIAAESVLDSPLLREALARRALPAGRRA